MALIFATLIALETFEVRMTVLFFQKKKRKTLLFLNNFIEYLDLLGTFCTNLWLILWIRLLGIFSVNTKYLQKHRSKELSGKVWALQAVKAF